MLSRRAALAFLGLTVTASASDAATSKKKPATQHTAQTGKSSKSTKTAKATSHGSKPKRSASAQPSSAGS